MTSNGHVTTLDTKPAHAPEIAEFRTSFWRRSGGYLDIPSLILRAWLCCLLMHESFRVRIQRENVDGSTEGKGAGAAHHAGCPPLRLP